MRPAGQQHRGGHQNRAASQNHAGSRKSYASSALAGQSQPQTSADSSNAGRNNQAAAPGPSVQAMTTSTSVQLSSLIGQHVAISLHAKQDTASASNINGGKAPQASIQGKLWAFDDRIGTLVLQTPPSGFRMIMLHSVSDISIVAPQQSNGTAVPCDAVEEPFTPIPGSVVQEREEAAVRDEAQRVARLPPSGSLPIAGEIFEALGKTLPVRWADNIMSVYRSNFSVLADTSRHSVVMDEVLVDPPYTSASCRSENATRLARVQKVLQGERTRIEASLS